MSSHLDTRRKLKAIPNVSRFDDLLDQSTLTCEDKEILRLHYLMGKDFRYIGDTLGYAGGHNQETTRKSTFQIK